MKDQTPSETSAPEATINASQVHTVHSRLIDQAYRICVALPETPMPAGQLLPVIYVLDANAAFGLVTETVRMLQMGFDVPPAMIVGIGYPVDTHMQTMFLRLRDYMPTVDEKFRLITEGYKAIAEEAEPGGAAQFLTFIEQELKPFIESHYDADPTDATLVGGSAGGTFGLFALLNYPDVFQRYVIGSPPFAWDDRLVFRYEEQYAAGHDDLNANVFLGVGGLETQEAFQSLIQRLPESMRDAYLAHGHTDAVELMEPMVQKLRSRNYPNLNLRHYVFADENHTSVVPALFSRGLREVFGMQAQPN